MARLNLLAALLQLKEEVRNSQRQPVQILTYSGSFEALDSHTGLKGYRNYVSSNPGLRLVAASRIDVTGNISSTLQPAHAPDTICGLHAAILNSANEVARFISRWRLALQRPHTPD